MDNSSHPHSQSRNIQDVSPEDCRTMVLYEPPKRARTNNNDPNITPGTMDELGLDSSLNHVSRVAERDAAAAATAGATDAVMPVQNPYRTPPRSRNIHGGQTPNMPTNSGHTASASAARTATLDHTVPGGQPLFASAAPVAASQQSVPPLAGYSGAYINRQPGSRAMVPVSSVMRIKMYRSNAANEEQKRDFLALHNFINSHTAYNALGNGAMFYNDHQMTAVDAEIAAGTSDEASNAKISGLPVMRANLADPNNNFNDIVTRTGLAQALLACGVTYIPGIQEYMTLSDSGTVENLQRAGNLLFSAIPCNFNNEPSLYNNVGMKEFMDYGTSGKKCNKQYWWKHVNFFKKNSNMNLAAWIPRFLLSAPTLLEHDQMVNSLHLRNGVGIGGSGEFFKLVLWRKYAIVFQKIMQMPVVMAARELGFWPLFLLRQCINQNVKKGIHAHLATTDLNGRSSLMLAGFQRDDTPPDAPPFSNVVFISVLGKTESNAAPTALLTQVPPRDFVSDTHGGEN